MRVVAKDLGHVESSSIGNFSNYKIRKQTDVRQDGQEGKGLDVGEGGEDVPEGDLEEVEEGVEVFNSFRAPIFIPFIRTEQVGSLFRSARTS